MRDEWFYLRDELWTLSNREEEIENEIYPKHDHDGIEDIERLAFWFFLLHNDASNPEYDEQKGYKNNFAIGTQFGYLNNPRIIAVDNLLDIRKEGCVEGIQV
jgi:hypothetical protein